MDAERYVRALARRLREAFGARLIYVGLQGSYARGEADAGSDIDVMVTLDELRADDLPVYRRLLEGLPGEAPSCGFLSGRAELAHWDAGEICQLVHETVDVVGSLRELVPAYTAADVRRYVRSGVGNLYHAMCHRTLHGPEEGRREALAGWYKAAFYLMQNLAFLRAGVFPRGRRELPPFLEEDERALMETGRRLRAGETVEPDEAFAALFDWCRKTIAEL